MTADITWRPFQLNPDMAPGGMARADYLAAKFGGRAHAQRINQTIVDAGNTAGIPFAFDKVERTPNTVDAHRLIRFADSRGAANEVVDRLFSGYFIEGLDIGDRDTLASIARQSGLDVVEAMKFLAGDSQRAEVLADDCRRAPPRHQRGAVFHLRGAIRHLRRAGAAILLPGVRPGPERRR